MTKEVLICISGLQVEKNGNQNDQEPIEVLNTGNYFFKNGKHYLLFEEMVEGFPGVIKTQIKIKGEDCVEMLKRGITNTHMIFDKSQRHNAYYETPYGQLHLGITTKNITVEEQEENINVKLEYVMDVDCEPVADCTIRINVKPKQAKDFSICDQMIF